MERSERTHSGEGVSCLLFVVVNTRDRSDIDVGRYEAILSVRSEMLAVDGKANERVAGSESPGKDSRRTLTLEEAMVRVCCGNTLI